MRFDPDVIFRSAFFLVLLSAPLIGAGAPSRDFPATPVRGFGTVSASLQPAPGGDASVLTITCENEDKARLVQAKFLSDEQELPGVIKIELKAKQWGVGSFRFGGTPFPAYEVKGQGDVAALRSGSKVLIGAATTGDGLVALVNGWDLRDPIPSDPEAKVPMWLDRYDQHGFRFYYWPGMKPQGQENKEYDVRDDFNFARDHGVGIVYWNALSQIMGADGQTDNSSWDWAEGWSKANNVPVAINVSALNYNIPSWLANRYRDGMMQPMPDYLGDSMSVANWRGTTGKVGELAWGATDARDAMLAALQTSVRRFDKDSNVVSWMEPHGEISQGGDDFLGYGPAADASFRDYLRIQYSGPDKVGAAWLGNPVAYKSWDDIHAPELADFLGWGPDALDLAGTWRVAFPDAAPTADMFTPAFDDSKWMTVTAPGDDRNFFLPKKLAVYRRNFDLPGDWTAKHPKTWIYLWDLNEQRNPTDPPVSITLNGQKVAESPCVQPRTHWMVAEATSFMKPGSNQLTLQLPCGYIGYRIYLTGTEPQQYPKLGEGLNTKWVDLCGWRQWARVEAVRRGMEMIREIDPNRNITLASPYYAADGEKVLAQKYGGEFHDTGFMTGVWADLLPSLMRGADLPDSVEPGGPAGSLPEFKTFLGRWQTEGLQQLDYFIHIGDVMWHPEIRKYFDEQLPQIHLIGKYHVPKADIAFLFSTKGDMLTGFPWSNDLNTNLPGAWMCCGMFTEFLDSWPRDAVNESDFAMGNAAKYKVIIDTNTSIMDDAFVDQIEKYVRGGGIFITFVNSGRHSPTKPDSWPISRLTGYDVLTHEMFDANGRTRSFDPKDPHPAGTIGGLTLHPAEGQTIYGKTDDWMNSPYHNGLRMKKREADAQDLLLWKDGTVAVGMRKIGQGAIIEFGCKNQDQPWLGIDTNAFRPILEWAKAKTNPVDVTIDKADAKMFNDYVFRHFVSNNGLYDIATIWNQSGTNPIKATFTFKENAPVTAVDVVTGQEYPIQNGKLADMPVEPLQTRIFLTPRHQIAQAAADWFELQRNWWRATAPVTKPFPKLSDRFVRDMHEDWSWHPLAAREDVAPLVATDYDDSAWPKLPLGSWSPDPARQDVKHALLRRAFTVPEEWNAGRVELWVQSTTSAFTESGQVWLDGTVIQPMTSESGVDGQTFNAALAPGTTHHLAVEIQSQGVIAGMTGEAWLNYIPAPLTTIDLAGTWTTCKDDIFHDTGTVTWPGDYAAHSLWRTVAIPASAAGKTVMFSMDADRPFQTFINGTRVEYSGRPWMNAHVELNITPWVHFGGDNRIQLVSTYDKGTMRNADLDFYMPGIYP